VVDVPSRKENPVTGSIRKLVVVAIGTAAVIAALILAGTSLAAPTRTSCSDLAYLNASIKATKKATASLKLAIKGRYGAAVTPAVQSLWITKHSTEPCDSDYWLQRRYEIHYGVALQRYMEEMRDGDEDSADIYWSSVKFWGNEIRDLSLEK
jgi:hypothetical protein